MLRLLLGTDWLANRDEILKQMAGEIAREQGGRILLVPEQISHEMERRLCTVAGDTASRFGEVLSFTRLASRVFAQTGGGARRVLDAGGRVIAMAAATEQLRAKLKIFAAPAARPEFLMQMLSTIDEFKSCCVTPETLHRASGESQGVLAQKLEELALLLEGYDAVCGGSGQDPRDRMTQLLEQMEASDFASRHRFYIDGFSDFTAQELAILSHLLEASPEVTVSLVCREPKDRATEFEIAGQTAFRLLKAAERAGVPVELQKIPPRQDGALKALREHLFSGTLRPLEGLSERAEALAFGSVWDECIFASQEILRLAREEQARFGEITLLCGDFPGYKPILQAVLGRYGISAYVSGTEEIQNQSVIQTVLTALEAAVTDFEQEPMLRYCKSVLSPLTPSQCDRLENYIVIWNIRGKGWLSPWTMHPDGLSYEMDEESEAALLELNALRQQVAGPLNRLRQGIQRGDCVGTQLRALTKFLEEIQLSQGLALLADRYEQAGDRRGAQELEQLWDILLDALEQMDGLLGKTIRDGESFYRLLTLLLSQYHVGTIPAALDQVTVGALSDLRRRQAKYVFLLGAEEGKLPPYMAPASLLTEAERQELLSLGVSLSGDLSQQMSKELSGIYSAVSAATEKVYFTVGGGQGAFLWNRVWNLLGKGGLTVTELSPWGDGWTAAGLLATAAQRQEAKSLGLEGAYDLVKEARDYRFGQVSPAAVRGLYGEKLRLSASQIDKVADCRFAYFMRYGLRAKERKEATVDPAQFGTFAHDVLEHTAKEVEEKGGFGVVSLEDTLKISQKHMEAYGAEHFGVIQERSSREAYLHARNMEELRSVVQELWEELRNAQFRPQGFELFFGEGGDLPPIALQGREMEAELIGYVDRVDLCRIQGVDYVRVVDYKTGKKEFDYCDILNGVGLQMLLYLYALEAGGEASFHKKLTPAGILYFPARNPIVNREATPEKTEAERRKELRRRGLLLNKEEVLQAMEPGEENVILPCKRKKGEVVSGVASIQQFRQLRDYVFGEVSRLIDRISGGDITPDPYYRGSYHDACRYCEYKDACHLDAYGKARPFQKVSEGEFWEKIGGGGNG